MTAQKPSTSEVEERWKKIISAYKQTALETNVMSRFFSDPHVTSSVVLERAFSLIFVQAYAVLDDVGLAHHPKKEKSKKKKCSHSQDIINCNTKRNEIAHEMFVINQVMAKDFLNIICNELVNNGYLPAQTNHI